MKPLLNTLFVTTQESYLAKDGECVAVYQGDVLKGKVPIHTLGGLVLFGQISCSPFLLGHCAENGVTVSWLTQNGRFLASMRDRRFFNGGGVAPRAGAWIEASPRPTKAARRPSRSPCGSVD